MGRNSESKVLSSRKTSNDINCQRYIYVLACLVGQHVTVKLKNNTSLTGIFHSYNGLGSTLSGHTEDVIILKYARQLASEDNLSGPIEDTLIINGNDISYISATKCPLDFVETKTRSTGFKTDSEISNVIGVANDRELEKWEPTTGETSVGMNISLEEHRNCPPATNWDQFEVNARRFQVKSTYQEELYTTILDVASIPQSVKEKAEQIAREIESSQQPGNDIDELFNDNGDEELKFGAVRGTGAYQTVQSDKSPPYPSYTTPTPVTNHSISPISLMPLSSTSCYNAITQHTIKQSNLTETSSWKESTFVQDDIRLVPSVNSIKKGSNTITLTSGVSEVNTILTGHQDIDTSTMMSNVTTVQQQVPNQDNRTTTLLSRNTGTKFNRRSGNPTRGSGLRQSGLHTSQARVANQTLVKNINALNLEPATLPKMDDLGQYELQGKSHLGIRGLPLLNKTQPLHTIDRSQEKKNFIDSLTTIRDRMNRIDWETASTTRHNILHIKKSVPMGGGQMRVGEPSHHRHHHHHQVPEESSGASVRSVGSVPSPKKNFRFNPNADAFTPRIKDGKSSTVHRSSGHGHQTIRSTSGSHRTGREPAGSRHVTKHLNNDHNGDDTRAKHDTSQMKFDISTKQTIPFRPFKVSSVYRSQHLDNILMTNLLPCVSCEDPSSVHPAWNIGVDPSIPRLLRYCDILGYLPNSNVSYHHHQKNSSAGIGLPIEDKSCNPSTTISHSRPRGSVPGSRSMTTSNRRPLTNRQSGHHRQDSYYQQQHRPQQPLSTTPSIITNPSTELLSHTTESINTRQQGDQQLLTHQQHLPPGAYSGPPVQISTGYPNGKYFVLSQTPGNVTMSSGPYLNDDTQSHHPIGTTPLSYTTGVDMQHQLINADGTVPNPTTLQTYSTGSGHPTGNMQTQHHHFMGIPSSQQANVVFFPPGAFITAPSSGTITPQNIGPVTPNNHFGTHMIPAQPPNSSDIFNGRSGTVQWMVTTPQQSGGLIETSGIVAPPPPQAICNQRNEVLSSTGTINTNRLSQNSTESSHHTMITQPSGSTIIQTISGSQPGTFPNGSQLFTNQPSFTYPIIHPQHHQQQQHHPQHHPQQHHHHHHPQQQQQHNYHHHHHHLGSNPSIGSIQLPGPPIMTSQSGGMMGLHNTIHDGTSHHIQTPTTYIGRIPQQQQQLFHKQHVSNTTGPTATNEQLLNSDQNRNQQGQGGVSISLPLYRQPQEPTQQQSSDQQGGTQSLGGQSPSSHRISNKHIRKNHSNNGQQAHAPHNSNTMHHQNQTASSGNSSYGI